MDAVLYMSCGMLDRGDTDIMVETAATKVFCSEYGWHVIDDAMQLMGGEGYMTENEFERTWRDNRIHRIVEGSNEVMQAFIFAYGGKQLAEYMLTLLNAIEWNEDQAVGSNLARIAASAVSPQIIRRGAPLAVELFLGKKRPRPVLDSLHPSLSAHASRLAKRIPEHSRQFKVVSKRLEEKIVSRQLMQARLADNAMLMFVWACVLSKMDHEIRSGATGPEFDRNMAAGFHFMNLADLKIRENSRELDLNADDSMALAAEAAMKFTDTLPNEELYIHESSPNAAGTGRQPRTDFVKQFPGDHYADTSVTGDGARTGGPSPAEDPRPEAGVTSA
jgi:acyl-CoA dehydrogenase family member 9